MPDSCQTHSAVLCIQVLSLERGIKDRNKPQQSQKEEKQLFSQWVVATGPYHPGFWSSYALYKAYL
jgi:hypothetical protein